MIIGYGLDKRVLWSISDKALISFARKHLTDKDIAGLSTMTDKKVLEVIEGFEDPHSHDTDKFAVISTVIAREKNVNIQYHGTERNDAVMFCFAAPWEYSEKDLSLTPVFLQAIFAPYTNELGIECNLSNIYM